VAEERDRAAEVARQLTGAVRAYSANRPRSLQRRIGPSEVGSPCTRSLGYKLAGVEPVNTGGGDPWASFVGTATHAELEAGVQAAPSEGWATEVRVKVDDELELAGLLRPDPAHRRRHRHRPQGGRHPPCGRPAPRARPATT
jgi:hypothetical protein